MAKHCALLADAQLVFLHGGVSSALPLSFENADDIHAATAGNGTAATYLYNMTSGAWELVEHVGVSFREAKHFESTKTRGEVSMLHLTQSLRSSPQTVPFVCVLFRCWEHRGAHFNHC